jgi:hypothetical protein
MRAEIVALAVLASACAFEEGEGFATIESAALTASFDPGSRRDPDGTLLVREGYRLTLEALEVELSGLVLAEARTISGTGGVFDPASPPAGYTLCHGGHCHHEDGRLVPYADVQAEITAGGGTAFADLVTMSAPGPFALGEPRAIVFSAFDPSPFLRESTIARVTLRLAKLAVRGTLAGDALGPDPVPLAVELAPIELAFALPLSPYEVSRDSAAELRVTGSFVVGPTLLDGVDYAALAAGGAIAIDEESEAGRAILEQLTEARFGAAVEEVNE